MTKKIIIIIYFLIVLAFAISSLLVTLSNDPKIIFILELTVDVIILFGIILFLYNKCIKWWLIPFLFSVIGEVFLLSIDVRVGIREAIQWAIILSPALYLNFQVTGFMHNWTKYFKKA